MGQLVHADVEAGLLLIYLKFLCQYSICSPPSPLEFPQSTPGFEQTDLLYHGEYHMEVQDCWELNNKLQIKKSFIFQQFAFEKNF